jgi:hypothetical protein
MPEPLPCVAEPDPMVPDEPDPDPDPVPDPIPPPACANASEAANTVPATTTERRHRPVKGVAIAV